jgi:hypothetical protein
MSKELVNEYINIPTRFYTLSYVTYIACDVGVHDSSGLKKNLNKNFPCNLYAVDLKLHNHNFPFNFHIKMMFPENEFFLGQI